MVNCIVKNCKTNSVNKHPGISFFSFPLKDPERLKIWICFTGKENWFPSKYSKICSLHFTENDFHPEAIPRKLKSYAVPTIPPTLQAFWQGNFDTGKTTPKLSASSVCTTSSDHEIKVVTSVNMPETEKDELKVTRSTIKLLERELAKKDRKIVSLQKQLENAKKKKSNGNKYMWLPKERSLWPLLLRR